MSVYFVIYLLTIIMIFGVIIYFIFKSTGGPPAGG